MTQKIQLLPIPNDWDEVQDGFCTLTAQVPNSPYWRAMARGALNELSLAYVWDATTGDAEIASQAGFDISASVQIDCT